MNGELKTNDRLLNHVLYEIKMLYYIFTASNKGINIKSNNPNDKIGIQDAVYTAFLLHYRNLYYFFNDMIQDKDIKISSFVKEKDKVCNYKLDFEIDRINKCLSHLATGRLGYEGRESFDFEDMFLSIINNCIMLFAYIKANNLTDVYVIEIDTLYNDFAQFIK